MNKAQSAAQSDNTASAEAKKRQKYEIWSGMWEAREQIRIPGSQNTLVLKWEFVKGKKLRENVVTDPEKVIQYNQAFQIGLGKTLVQQLIEQGNEEPVYHTLPNPYEIEKIIG